MSFTLYYMGKLLEFVQITITGVLSTIQNDTLFLAGIYFAYVQFECQRNEEMPQNWVKLYQIAWKDICLSLERLQFK